MATGNNRGQLSKQCSVVQSGAFSGRAFAYKKGPGVPGKKKKRKVWYEGPPYAPTGRESDTRSSRYSFAFKEK